MDYCKTLLISLIDFLFEKYRIPMNDKYKIHKAFERQIQTLGGTNILNYFRDLSSKGTRVHEGEVRFSFWILKTKEAIDLKTS